MLSKETLACKVIRESSVERTVKVCKLGIADWHCLFKEHNLHLTHVLKATPSLVQDGARIVDTLKRFTQSSFIGHMSQSVWILFF
jgi:hypothetical protein